MELLVPGASESLRALPEDDDAVRAIGAEVVSDRGRGCESVSLPPGLEAAVLRVAPVGALSDNPFPAEGVVLPTADGAVDAVL